jgi:hypothetical protein
MKKQSMNEFRSRLDNQMVDGDDTYLQLCIDILTFNTDFDTIDPVGERKQLPSVSGIPSGGNSKVWSYKSLTIACTTILKDILGSDENKRLMTSEVFDL